MLAGPAILRCWFPQAARHLCAFGVGLLIAIPLFAWSEAPDYYQLGARAYAQGQLEEALGYMKKAMVEHPADPDVRYYLALCLDKLNRDKEALLQYEFVRDRGTDPRLVSYSQTRVSALQAMTPRLVNVTSAQSLIVPLKEARNALMVDVTIQNSQSGKSVTGTFIIDTGATYTSISEDMARQLGLNLSGEVIKITTANGRIDVPKVNLDSLNVNGIQAHDVSATVIPIKSGSTFQGLLGLSFIRQFKMTIDPQANHLVLEPN